VRPAVPIRLVQRDAIVRGLFLKGAKRTTSMKTKAKAPSRDTPRLQAELPAAYWLAPPWSLKERLQRIEAIGRRLNGYIGFICQVDSLNGTSAEAKERAVIACYERMVALERQLIRIREDLELG
jgi:hypothetical protein